MIGYPKSWRETKKYLAYDHLTYNSSGDSHGFLHQWTELNAICLDAILANRIPVLPRNLTLSKFHNPAGSLLSSWDRYWDLKETKFILYYFYPFSGKIVHQATYSVPVFWVDDIKDWISKKSHKVVSTEVPTDLSSIECELVYRRLSSPSLWSQHFKKIRSGYFTYRKVKKYYQLMRYQYLEKAFFHRKPSPEVWAVVADIVKQLGSGFWAIHIRRNDLLNNPIYPHSKYASNISWITANLECTGLNKETVLFLMTDERDSSYLLSLQEKFNIVRATDFMSYKNLTAKYPGDNFLCFHIERLIYMHAKRRYRTATHSSGAFEFISFLEPVYEKLNYLPPYHPLPVNCKKKYFSYLSLERKHRLLNQWPALLPLRYSFAQNILHFRLKLNQD